MNSEKLKKHIPALLLYSRLLFAFIIIIITFLKPENARAIVLTLMYIGILTDIFDGIIARNLNVSNPTFRLLDTIFDLFFYLSILFFIISINPGAISKNILLICGILSLEGLMYLVSLIRFGKLPSPHSILSKFWGIYMIVEFSLLIIGVAGPHFTIALIFGLVAHLDRALIYLLLPQWDHDIPSSYHALLLRQGKQISRKKIFNG